MSAAKTTRTRPVLPARIHYLPGMRDPERAPTAPAQAPVPRPHLEAYFLPSAVLAPPVRGRGPSKRRLDPPRWELLEAIDRAEAHMTRILSRWVREPLDGTPAAAPGTVRAELHEVGAPLLDLLQRAGRR